jgi:SHR-binding domain of vacuolar-sorting associated protein 13
VDCSGSCNEGEWESSSDLDKFSVNRVFNPCHRYRRRRWYRSRHGRKDNCIISGVNAFIQLPRDNGPVVREDSTEHHVQLAIQVNGGRWSQISTIPRQGSYHGVVRVSKSRWLYPDGEAPNTDKTVYELCYDVSPLDGDWGLLTRSFLVTSRFVLRNESKVISFQVKQCGAEDDTSLIIQPGQVTPFHWGSYHLPELISVRPSVTCKDRFAYKWSGGFNPLLIGHLPLRVRKLSSNEKIYSTDEERSNAPLLALKIEIEIRPQTGGTGINLTVQEEETSGQGSLFRIENLSTLPIWFCQDEVLANPTRQIDDTDYSDIVNPSDSIAFSLDIPFKKGKFSHRKAAGLTSLLRVRLALAPLTTRAGVETTKVVSLIVGETVRLNPSKLMMLTSEIRRILHDVRIVGVVVNDGPTRVLRLRYENARTEINASKFQFLSRSLLSFTLSLTSQRSSNNNPWSSFHPMAWHDDIPFVLKAIVQGAGTAAELQKLQALPSESEITQIHQEIESGKAEEIHREYSESDASNALNRNLIVSFRAALSGLTVSLVDAAPSEIAVATFKNINALATWDTLRATNSTIFITVTSLQVDNMVPNSPFPVAVSPFDQPSNTTGDENTLSKNDSPLLVVGLSFAPKHKSGILVSDLSTRVYLSFNSNF